MTSSPIKISIIEDIKDIALELKSLFNEQEDLTCIQVYHTAEEAITFLPKNPVDVVIVDIGLPGMSGIQAIITLKETHCPMHNSVCSLYSKTMQKYFKASRRAQKDIS